MTLSEDLLETLRALSRKQSGAVIGWVSIAQARRLTDLGLAAREPSGWRITAEGEAVIKEQAIAPKPDGAVLAFPSSAAPTP